MIPSYKVILIALGTLQGKYLMQSVPNKRNMETLTRTLSEMSNTSFSKTKKFLHPLVYCMLNTQKEEISPSALTSFSSSHTISVSMTRKTWLFPTNKYDSNSNLVLLLVYTSLMLVSSAFKRNEIPGQFGDL